MHIHFDNTKIVALFICTKTEDVTVMLIIQHQTPHMEIDKS